MAEASGESAKYCEVALPVPLPQTFTYSIPDGTSVEDMLVVVASGSRELVGVVVGFCRDSADVNRTKVRSLTRVLDEVPAITPEFISLARWVADYYLTPLGEVLPALLPRAASLRKKTLVRLTDAGRSAL